MRHKARHKMATGLMMMFDFHSRQGFVERTAVTVALVTSLALVSTQKLSAQDRSARSPAQQSSVPAARTVAAMVDGEAVFADEVQDSLSIALAGRQVASEYLPGLQARALEQIIGRRLVEAHLLRNGYTPSEAQIEQANALFVSQLRTNRIGLTQYLKERDMTKQQLRRRLIGELAWKNGWPRHLNQRMTDQRIDQYLQAHPGEFDGTQRRASHVLLRVNRPQDPSAFGEVVERARTIRREIVEGTLLFTAAVEKYSQGPSRRQKGDLGFFPRHGVMDENFAKAAFELEEGQISEPIASPFGIHLIRCTEIKRDTKTWQDIRGELTPLQSKSLLDAVSRELFAELAGRLRADAKVEITGRVPYLEPGTRELVVPK